MENKNLLSLAEESMGGDMPVPYNGSSTPSKDVVGNIYAIHAYTDTVINEVTGEEGADEWNGKTIPANVVLLLRCTEITFTSGTGACYKRKV